MMGMTSFFSQYGEEFQILNYDLIVFDLDDTLLDTSKELLPIANTPEYRDRINSPLPMLPGAQENLIYLSQHYRLFLLTQGDPEIQQLKIKNLGISSYFNSIFIANKLKGESKDQYFAEFVSKGLWRPHRCLSIGNRIKTDLLPAQEVGFKTCHFFYGEYLDELDSSMAPSINFIVYDHKDLLRTCSL
jgi:FMN phosphatase YigB (HAD superfamily)